jgi:transcriptional regulator with XRE-family HTH domain
MSSLLLIKQRLKDLGFTQKVFAEHMGWTKDHTSKIILGKLPLPRQTATLRKVAEVLQFDPLLLEEYRAQFPVLPPTIRRMKEAFNLLKLDLDTYAEQVGIYSHGHLKLMLSAQTPLPKNREDLLALLKPLNIPPHTVSEYLNLVEYQPDVLILAQEALTPTEYQQFQQSYQAVLTLQNSYQDPFSDRFEKRVILTLAQQKLTQNKQTDDQSRLLRLTAPFVHLSETIQQWLDVIAKTPETLDNLDGLEQEDKLTLFAALKGQVELTVDDYQRFEELFF